MPYEYRVFIEGTEHRDRCHALLGREALQGGDLPGQQAGCGSRRRARARLPSGQPIPRTMGRASRTRRQRKRSKVRTTPACVLANGWTPFASHTQPQGWMRPEAVQAGKPAAAACPPERVLRPRFDWLPAGENWKRSDEPGGPTGVCGPNSRRLFAPWDKGASPASRTFDEAPDVVMIRSVSSLPLSILDGASPEPVARPRCAQSVTWSLRTVQQPEERRAWTT
jgi:hypothetical protein